MENKGQNGNPDLDAMRMMLAELSARGQARREYLMQQHEDWKAEMDKYAAETRKHLAVAGRHLRALKKRPPRK